MVQTRQKYGSNVGSANVGHVPTRRRFLGSEGVVLTPTLSSPKGPYEATRSRPGLKLRVGA